MDPLNSHLNALLEFLAHRFQQLREKLSLTECLSLSHFINLSTNGTYSLLTST